VFRLPVGDHEVLVRFESIQVAQNLVINNVLSWEAQQPVTFSEYQNRAVGDGSVRPSRRATPNGDHTTSRRQVGNPRPPHDPRTR